MIKNIKGKFVVVEGLDGSGKTSAIIEIIKILNKNNINNVVSTREPGGTRLGEKLRSIIKYDIESQSICKYAELLIMYAARSQLIKEIIKPSLKKGLWVISDRYYLSSIAYQGYSKEINFHLIDILQKVIVDDCYPDLTIYLDVDPKIGINRIRNRGHLLDKFEKKSINLFKRINTIYNQVIKKNKNTILINANQSFKHVIQDINSNLEKWIYMKKT